MMNMITRPIPLDINGKIFVCCPGGAVTGGPELLHQLVDALRKVGHDAYITYYPFDKSYKKPVEYSAYNCPASPIEDSSTALVIIPEITTKLAKTIKNAQTAIWWLSVDNYYQRKGKSQLRDFRMRIITLLRSRIPIRSMHNLLHFTQSAYARDFLKNYNIKSRMLTDYLAAEHFNANKSQLSRRNTVAYNPNKGAKKTNLLLKKYPEIEFIPIKGMTKTQVNDLFSTAKIYIDFGLHPGKDRLPREAALAGCCIITGIHGSAGNKEDMPIPEEYKLEDRTNSFVSKFGFLANSIFDSFDEHSSRFSSYRERIKEEPKLFREQVLNIFGSKKDINDQ
jgi:hypothetical protein